MVGGEERWYLQDYDVEIAEKATIADPTVVDQFQGFTFWCRPTASRAGRVVAMDFGVTGIPALQAYDIHGNQLGVFAGAHTTWDLLDWLSECKRSIP